MNEENRKKYNELKNKNTYNVILRKRENNELFKECILSLGEKIKILDFQLQENILKVFNNQLDLINKQEVYKKEKYDSIANINISQEVYIIWNEVTLPVLQGDFMEMQNKIDEIKAVDFETWLVTEDMKQIIHMNDKNQIWLYKF